MGTSEATILVVDDNQDNRDLIQRRLERAGYTVICAENGMEGLEKVQSEGIDLVILDIMMPGLTGIDVLRILRQTRTSADLPIIMATAKDQSEDVVEALDHGANDYVTKPLDFPVVLARVHSQLRSKKDRKATPAPRSATSRHDIRPGAILVEKYRLEEELGSGNFGKVFRAVHMGFGQHVAVKVLQASVDDSAESIARFQQEGSSAFRLQHPNAVSVLDFHATEEGLAFLVMELLDGRSLEKELKEHRRLPPRKAIEILLPICQVLTEAHGIGIVHRDIKPANIFLHRTRLGEMVKVLDFGIAKLIGDAAMEKHLTLDDGILGTPAYMAPERLRAETYDGRADVYSLGIMLYQLLVGHPPFRTDNNEAIAVAMMHLTHQPEPPRIHRPEIPQSLEALILAALAKEPSARPTALELGKSLADLLEPVTASAEEDTEPEGLPVLRLPDRPDEAMQTTTLSLDVSDLAQRNRMFDFSMLLEAPHEDDPRLGSINQKPVPIRAARELGEPWEH